LRPLDILSLRALVAATQQDHNLRPARHVINAVAGTISNPHLHYAATYAPDVTRISQLHAADSGDDPCDGIDILQAIQPENSIVWRTSIIRNIVAYGLQRVKHPLRE
jgi:hypothetical protein